MSDFREDIAQVLRNGELQGQPEWRIEKAVGKIIEILMRMGVCIPSPKGIRLTSKARSLEVWKDTWEIARQEGVFDTAG